MAMTGKHRKFLPSQKNKKPKEERASKVFLALNIPAREPVLIFQNKHSETKQNIHEYFQIIIYMVDIPKAC